MIPAKGKADFLALGDWNVVCYECGMKFKASTMRKHWQGYYVCPQHWEPRHPQDFVKGLPDAQTPPWTQAQPQDNVLYFCTMFDLPLTVDTPTTIIAGDTQIICNKVIVRNTLTINGTLRILS